jgi:HlyD family secretion protein
MDRILEKKKWPPKKIITFSVIGLIVVFVLYNFIFGDKSSKLNVDVNKITISVLTKGPFQEFIPVIGNVVPITTIYLDIDEGGKVDQILVEPGSLVKKGDVILKLVNASRQYQFMDQEATLSQQIDGYKNSKLEIEKREIDMDNQLFEAEINYLKQKSNFERIETIKHTYSQKEYEQYKYDYELAEKKRVFTIENAKRDSILRKIQLEQIESSLNRTQKHLDMLRENLENSLTVRAPIAGQLASLDAEIGQLKGGGSRLGQIDVIDSFKVRVSIDEHYISRINRGQIGEFDLQNVSHKLIITKVFPEINQGKFEVDMLFKDKAPQGIRRGQTLHIRLELGDLAEAILLPNGGFFQKTGGNWIYVIDQSETYAVKRQIKLGRKNPEYFEVLEGLEPGEKVITSSYDNFGDIDKLILK